MINSPGSNEHRHLAIRLGRRRLRRAVAAAAAISTAGLLALPVQAAQAAPVSAHATCCTITVNQAAVTAKVTRPGASVKKTFRGTVGERVSEVLTNVMTSDDGCETVTLLNPAGGTVDSGQYCGNGNNVGVGPDVLTAKGVYTIKVTVDSSATGGGKLWLSAPVSQGAIFVNKAAQPMDFTRVGQGLERTFTGYVGELAAEVLTNVTTTDDGCETVTLLNPTGGTVDSGQYCGNGNNIGVGPDVLTVKGTYTIRVEIDTIATGTAKLWLSKPVSLGSITPGGPAEPMNVTRVGQGVERGFRGSAGEQISAVVNHITTTDDGCETLTLENSGGPVTSGSYCGNGNPVSIGPVTLPTSGPYTVLYQVDTGATGTGRLTVSR